ncbi:hypothetical protein FRC12_018363 [Ceratobasidium sp. 428]|nr:hypothetical protein FRC12_018363 [Ceratobasidium sp. 428]
MQDRFVLKRSHSTLSSLRHLRTQILALSGLKPVLYDCCKDSCVCFAGPFADLTACPDCGAPRKTSAGAPQNTFEFLPPIPQFRALFCDPEACKAMQYWHNYSEDPSKISDIFGGKRYQELRHTQVEVDGVRQPFKFFEDHHEVALGVSADGMCPFKKRKKSCWPLILVNYNLPPEERTHVDNLICVGVIPGPKSPTNMSSFLWPLIEQLLELATGVTTVDILSKELFLMRAHLLAIFGDIPAISKLLEFLGHNACFPCRFCMIMSIRGFTSSGGSHLYCPLHRTEAPLFDPFNLPLRTHEATIQKGFEILEAPTDAARTRLATGSGVKGISALSRVPSVSVPISFPIDIMHMIFLNLFPQLMDIWTGHFHELDQGSEQYLIDKELWKALGETIGASGATIPSLFGCCVPNLALPSHGNANAEAWNMFGLYIAPYLLQRRFRKPKYYRHFVSLIKLLKQATSYDLPRAEIPALREGITEWIQDFEGYYYQYNPNRMEVCTVNIHYLLHLVDAIEQLGLPGGYWSFLMERFCSLVGFVVKSRRFPFENISRNIRDQMQLKVLRHLYGSHGSLGFLREN